MKPIMTGDEMEKMYDGPKTAKLGTKKRPAVVTVQTEERMKEVASIFKENDWEYTIELEPDKPEDSTDWKYYYIRQKPG